MINDIGTLRISALAILTQSNYSVVCVAENNARLQTIRNELKNVIESFPLWYRAQYRTDNSHLTELQNGSKIHYFIKTDYLKGLSYNTIILDNCLDLNNFYKLPYATQYIIGL